MIAAMALSLLATACTEPMFMGGEPVVRTAPPEPRNRCEEMFAWLLTDDLGTAEETPPTPAPDALSTVLSACTAGDLLEADDYFAFDSGRAMERLTMRRLFNGPGRDAQLVAFCDSALWAATKACETLSDDQGG